MIAHIRHKGLKLLYGDGDRSRLRPDIADKAERFLYLLEKAEVIESVNLPGFRLHALTGDLREFWSVSVSRNHRIIFRFKDGYAYDVDLIDYH